MWTTEVDASVVRGSAASGVVKLLLDGQQRVTSLYGVINGEPPEFFQGNAKAFADLYFNVRSETFEFYGPVKKCATTHTGSRSQRYSRLISRTSWTA